METLVQYLLTALWHFINVVQKRHVQHADQYSGLPYYSAAELNGSFAGGK
jgi:hypothetical protein